MIISNDANNPLRNQMENKMPKIYVDPSLQSFMDPLLTIARGTFAKDGNDETLTNSALLTFAGIGLVKLVCGQNGPTWFPTDLLIELSKEPRRPIDLTPFMAPSADFSIEPQMTGSLRLMIDDIVEIKRQQQQPELVDDNNYDAVLLALTGLELTSLDDVLGDKPIWAARPDLVDRFESIRAGLCGRVSNRKSKLQLDDLLETFAEQYHEMVKIRLGKKAKKRATTIAMLLTHERAGLVIAYKDAEGHLAWKASAELRDEFEEA
jgi:hypothetical protein